MNMRKREVEDENVETKKEKRGVCVDDTGVYETNACVGHKCLIVHSKLQDYMRGIIWRYVPCSQQWRSQVSR